METARALDPKRLRKQIIECRQILDALNGNSAWSNHPCVLQYRGYEEWLEQYVNCLKSVQNNDGILAKACNFAANLITPEWHTQEYYDQMKRRLYTKDPEHYKQWADLGESQENYYYVDGEWRKYVNGKRVE